MHNPTCTRNPLCRHCAELLSLSLSFLQPGSFIMLVKHAGGSHASGNWWKETTYIPKSTSLKEESKQNCLKASYFISRMSLGQKEILVKEKNHHVRQSPEKSSVPQVLSVLSSLQLTALQLLLLPGLGFCWLPVQYKQQWLIWMRKLAGAVWQGLLESLSMVGIASQQRSTWGALLGSPGVCTPQPHGPIPLYRLPLKSYGLQLTVLTQTISF